MRLRFDFAGTLSTPVFSRSSSILIDASALVRSCPDLFASLTGERVEVGNLRAGHRLIARGPFGGVFDRAIIGGRSVRGAHRESLCWAVRRTRLREAAIRRCVWTTV